MDRICETVSKIKSCLPLLSDSSQVFCSAVKAYEHGRFTMRRQFNLVSRNQFLHSHLNLNLYQPIFRERKEKSLLKTQVLGFCGGLNRNDPQRLIYLNVWSLGSGIA